MIFKNVPLKKYNTFGLEYNAENMIHIRTEDEAISLFSKNVAMQGPYFILGGGSNILFTSDFKGTILYSELDGINIEESGEKDENVVVSAGAGVTWDDFVEWVVNKGFGGAENLSLIPGKAGATPIQNIGAYGVEVRDLILKVRTVSLEDGSIRIFSNKECEFGYRSSIFKNDLKGKYMVTRVFYNLSLNPRVNLSYGSLKSEVERLGGENLRNVRQGVINIRKSKLPDPEIIGNAGSFFKNSVVSDSFAKNLTKDYPEMPFFSDKEGFVKLASGWLIDQCGWKGKIIGNVGVHDKQALVLINFGKATGKEIYALSEEIKDSVKERFGVILEREVEVVGSI
jgi:UDP-N-acetylmuramate dehydrogenase